MNRNTWLRLDREEKHEKLPDVYRMKPISEEVPEEGQVIIAKFNNTKEQVEVKDGVCFLWRYGITEDKFCDVAQIESWRGCGGFDF